MRLVAEALEVEPCALRHRAPAALSDAGRRFCVDPVAAAIAIDTRRRQIADPAQMTGWRVPTDERSRHRLSHRAGAELSRCVVPASAAFERTAAIKQKGLDALLGQRALPVLAAARADDAPAFGAQSRRRAAPSSPGRTQKRRAPPLAVKRVASTSSAFCCGNERNSTGRRSRHSPARDFVSSWRSCSWSCRHPRSRRCRACPPVSRRRRVSMAAKTPSNAFEEALAWQAQGGAEATRRAVALLLNDQPEVQARHGTGHAAAARRGAAPKCWRRLAAPGSRAAMPRPGERPHTGYTRVRRRENPNIRSTTRGPASVSQLLGGDRRSQPRSELDPPAA